MEEECTFSSFNQRFMLEEIFQTLSSALVQVAWSKPQLQLQLPYLFFFSKVKENPDTSTTHPSTSISNSKVVHEQINRDSIGGKCRQSNTCRNLFFFFLIQVGTLIIASILALSGIRDSLGTVFDRATQLPESARLALLA